MSMEPVSFTLLKYWIDFQGLLLLRIFSLSLPKFLLTQKSKGNLEVFFLIEKVLYDKKQAMIG